jgi:hypothetical protein
VNDVKATGCVMACMHRGARAKGYSIGYAATATVGCALAKRAISQSIRPTTNTRPAGPAPRRQPRARASVRNARRSRHFRNFRVNTILEHVAESDMSRSPNGAIAGQRAAINRSGIRARLGGLGSAHYSARYARVFECLVRLRRPPTIRLPAPEVAAQGANFSFNAIPVAVAGKGGAEILSLLAAIPGQCHLMLCLCSALALNGNRGKDGDHEYA